MTREETRAEDDAFAAGLRGFEPLGLVAIAVVVLAGAVRLPGFVTLPLGALLALAWARLSHTPLTALGFGRPKSWLATLAGGIAIGVALKLAMKALVLPLLGAPAVNAAYHDLTHNTAVLPGAALSMVVAAGFGEETVFRGFAFERLGKLLGGSAAAKLAILAITTAGFALAHLADQGAPGAEQAAVTGLVFGGLYLATGRLWLSMAAHAAFDLTALALIYFDVERAVAQSLFG